MPAPRRRSIPATRKTSSGSSSRTPTPRCCCCRPTALDEARRAAGDVPILTVEMDAAGTVSLGGKPLGGRAEPPAVDDVALILHTSGSTGRPKRVPLSHANLSISARQRRAQLRADRRRRVAVRDAALPRARPGRLDAGHARDRRHGRRAGASSARCRSGASRATTAPRGTRRCRRSTSCCWRASKPGAPQPAGAEKLRFIRSCSASLPPQVMHDLEAAFGAPVLEAYGMTEAAHQMASNPLPPGARKPGSVGPGTDVRHQHHGRRGPAPRRRRARRGRASRARTSSRGYENNPEANATSFFDGWFRTGDQGFLDESGYLTLVGPAEGADQPRRREDLAARDRRGAARRTRRSPRRSASACRTRCGARRSRRRSSLKGTATEAELLAYCKERLADFKRPKQIHITDAIPRTATGKIQRRVVAQAFAPKAS